MSEETKKTKFIHVDDDIYTVGYGKPPKATQFPKGVSGNRKGRKRNIEFFKWEDPVFEVLFEDLTLPDEGQTGDAAQHRVDVEVHAK